MSGATLFDKVWDAHLVAPESASTPAVLYVDLHLIHEVTSPQAFETLRRRGLGVRRPERTVATMDHSTPTTPAGADGRFHFANPQAESQVARLAANCAELGIRLFELGDERQGIVHVIGPELGLTQPGMTIVCGDSHTATHGAFGALAFGIGTSEVGHVLATQCLLQRRPKTLEVRVDGRLPPGVTAKDLILAVIARIGVDGATGCAIEYAGPAIEALEMEERMTVCNMSIEAGGRAGMIAPDDTTFEYLAGRPYAPAGEAWERAVAAWRLLKSDDASRHERRVGLDATALEPMITFGTNPGMAIPIRGAVPAANGDASLAKALAYLGLPGGQPLLGKPIDVVFIGSCTNSRISDLRLAASCLDGRRVAAGTRMVVVPGSQAVKRQAEAEGLDRVFRAAGAEWREAGCSMCLAMNGDRVAAGQYAVSTSNRNFEGRQGPGARTFLASPLTAAASAIAGAIADPRELLVAAPVEVRIPPRRPADPPSPIADGAATPAETGTEASGPHRAGRARRAERRTEAVRATPAPREASRGRPFRRLRSRFVVLDQDNVDTDQIIPARFLTATGQGGFGAGLFADWRYDGAGEPRPDFVLNTEQAAGAEVLVTGRNFGCGSSREHAAWALAEGGFRAVVSVEIADIFTTNALKNGLLPAVIDAGSHERLRAAGSGMLEIDVERQVLRWGDGHEASFPLDPFAKHCLLEGVDELGFLLGRTAAIEAFEAARGSGAGTSGAGGRGSSAGAGAAGRRGASGEAGRANSPDPDSEPPPGAPPRPGRQAAP